MTDNLSPKATVTIVIKKGSKTAKTCKVGKRATGKKVSYSFTCKLARGHYKFIVKAKDLAGNPQESPAGSRSLTVT